MNTNPSVQPCRQISKFIVPGKVRRVLSLMPNVGRVAVVGWGDLAADSPKRFELPGLNVLKALEQPMVLRNLAWNHRILVKTIDRAQPMIPVRNDDFSVP